MRQRFNLDLVNLDNLMVLFHGAYGAGKTHIQGDFLRWASAWGPVRFLNIKGEDGASSIAGMGLGMVGETVASVGEYKEALADYAKDGLVGLAIDSMTAFYSLMLLDIVGEVRYPDPKLDGERSKMMWGQLSIRCKQRILDSRSAAKYVVWVAPHDRSEDPVSGGRGTTPDLPGKMAWGCGGVFDFVGHMTAETPTPGYVVRKVNLAPSGGLLTRQRAPRPILKPITIPADKGGWEAVFGAIEAAFFKGGQQ